MITVKLIPSPCVLHQCAPPSPPPLPLLEWQLILNRVGGATEVFDLLKIGESITPGWFLCLGPAQSSSRPAGPLLRRGLGDDGGEFSAGREAAY